MKRNLLKNFKNFFFLKKKIEDYLLHKKKKIQILKHNFNFKRKFLILILPTYSSNVIFFKLKGNILRIRNKKKLNCTIKLEGLLSKNKYKLNYNPYSNYLYTL